MLISAGVLSVVPYQRLVERGVQFLQNIWKSECSEDANFLPRSGVYENGRL